MTLLQNDKAVFYHPLNDATESLKAQAWAVGSGDLTGAGKVSLALSAVAADAVDSFGTEAVFNTAVSGTISAVILSPTSFVVAYQDSGNNGFGTAIVGTITGTVITYGAEKVFNGANTQFASTAALSPTSFVVAYRDIGNGNLGTAIVGTITGTVITYGAEKVFNAGTTANISAATLLSPTSFIVSYRDEVNADFGTAIVGTVAGTVITFGADVVFNAGNTTDISTAVISATSFVVSYRDGSNVQFGTAIVGTVVGTVITFGSEKVFNAGTTTSTSTAVLSPTSFVVSYIDGGNGNFGTAIVGTVTGTTITFGAEALFNSASTDNIFAAIISPTSFVVSYVDVGNGNFGTTIVGTVSGTVITFGAEKVFNAANTSLTSIAILSQTSFVVAYQDNGNNNFGTATVGSILPPSASLTASTPAAYSTAAAATKVAFAGWMKNPSA